MGILYVVATPIGNLDDISIRAIEILKSVDLIACEDSRITGKLLAKHHIATKLVSYHQHSSNQKADWLINQLRVGYNIALVTDAGTPGIQDSGGRLVKLARDSGALVEPIPGPSALTAALSASGINADAFCFLGFLPKKKGRVTLFKTMQDLPMPIILYESPMRVQRTLMDLKTYLGNRQLIVMRELTKKFSETKIGTTDELIKYFSVKAPKGEFVIIVTSDIY